MRGRRVLRDKLLDITRERLYCLAQQMLRRYPGIRRWEQTDDVLQNSALRLRRALEKVKPDSVRSFINLAAVQMRRELIDLTRHYDGPQGLGRNHASRAGRDGSTSTLGVAELGVDTSEPGSLSDWTEFHNQVASLPDVEREVFDLLWYQEMTQADAAAILGVTERVVKWRWRSARLKLHEALDGRMPGM